MRIRPIGSYPRYDNGKNAEELRLLKSLGLATSVAKLAYEIWQLEENRSSVSFPAIEGYLRDFLNEVNDLKGKRVGRIQRGVQKLVIDLAGKSEKTAGIPANQRRTRAAPEPGL